MKTVKFETPKEIVKFMNEDWGTIKNGGHKSTILLDEERVWSSKGEYVEEETWNSLKFQNIMQCALDEYLNEMYIRACHVNEQAKWYTDTRYLRVILSKIKKGGYDGSANSNIVEH